MTIPMQPRTKEDLRTLEAPAKSGQPRVGFLGAGWIGMHRLKAVAAADVVQVAAVADLNLEAAHLS
ncbi:MAG TPA: hypothetical protein VHM64_21960, partial [Candidatus Binatia bacterium]|nr:hypothetical protein [Candidatus Binatia bacterium]